MSRRNGRAYIFVRWSGSPTAPMRLGDVAWAFEYNDRLARFNCFYCGATESVNQPGQPAGRSAWQEKCFTLPELVKTMSHQGSDRLGYDEVKVFEVDEADPDAALQLITQRSTSSDSIGSTDSLGETREILKRYGVRGLADGKAFSAPFLWYNMLAGRSVPLRKLPVHLFRLRASEAEGREAASPAQIEDHARKIAQEVPGVLDLGECLVRRLGTSFLVGLTVVVDGGLSVRDAHAVTQRVQESIRNVNGTVRHVLIQVEPND